MKVYATLRGDRRMQNDGPFDYVDAIVRSSKCWFLVAFFLLPSMAQASDASTRIIEPGYWQIRTDHELQGLAVLPKQTTEYLCLSAADIDAGRIALPNLRFCRVTGGERNGDTVKLKLDCQADSQPRIVAEVKGEGKALSGLIDLTGLTPEGQPTGIRFIYRHKGNWLGAECPVPASK